MMLSDHQIECARRFWRAFASPFDEFRYGEGHADTLRMVIRGTSEYLQPYYGEPWVFVVHPEGNITVEYPMGSPPDPLDSDGPDYNPEILADYADIARKRAKGE